MPSRTTLVAASLVLAVAGSDMAAAQQPAVASGTDTPGVEQDADIGSRISPTSRRSRTSQRSRGRRRQNTGQETGSVYYGDWDGSGQILVRAVGNGPDQINRFGSLDPTECGTTDREKWHEAQFAENTCLRTDEGGSPACPTGGNMPHAIPPSFADGIEGIRFTPGSPFAIRGGLQVFF